MSSGYSAEVWPYQSGPALPRKGSLQPLFRNCILYISGLQPVHVGMLLFCSSQLQSVRDQIFKRISRPNFRSPSDYRYLLSNGQPHWSNVKGLKCIVKRYYPGQQADLQPARDLSLIARPGLKPASQNKDSPVQKRKSTIQN